MSDILEGSGSVWGDLNGVRPAKILTKLVAQGMSVEQAGQRMESFGVSKRRVALCEHAATASLNLQKRLGRKDICLYIGIPFCPSRCSYCSFVTHSVKQAGKLIAPFLDMLRREIIFAGELMRSSGLRLRAAYMGGGTPTTLTAAQLGDVFGWLQDSFDLAQLEEFTVEAGRPDTVDSQKLDVIRRAGADRISINPQTFIPQVLQTIGRGHTVEELLKAFNLAREAGFTTINMDLIAGLPGDTVEGFSHSVHRAIELGTENITVHNLAIKRGSRLNLEKAPLPDTSAVEKMLDNAHEQLYSGGYHPYYLYRQKRTAGGYENVGWTLEAHRSIYNICIMEELGGILSLGGGGVTKMVNTHTGYIKRNCNPKYPYEYNTGEEKIRQGKLEFFQFYENLAGGESDV